MTLSADGSTVLSAGDTRLELWRSDMVRMIGYGALDARIKPGRPRPAAVPAGVRGREHVGRLGAAGLPRANGPAAHPADARRTRRTSPPADVQLPGVPAGTDARVIAVSDTTTAVYLPTPKPVVNVIDDTGTTIASTALAAPARPQATMSRAGDLITWWTGDSAMVFDANQLRYRYTVSPVNGQAPVGPATKLAGKLLVPVTAGYDVFNAQTGAGEPHIALTRPPTGAGRPRRRGPHAARAARRHPGGAGLPRRRGCRSEAPCPTSSA